MVRTILSAVLIGALGCSSNGKTEGSAAQPAAARTELAAPGTDTPPAKDPGPAAAPERVACKDHGDCMSSCSQGAVSTAWWKKAFPGDEGCEDGCADAHAGPPRCESGRCVAYDRDGARRAECTDRTDTPVAPIGPAHFCNEDADCTSSCKLGAVNKRWLESHSIADCRGGCTAVGFQAPRCEANLCVAYRKTGDKPVRVDACTRKSIWQ